MNFSRWGGWGDHRHPVHFSGDTHSNWEVLEFLPSFTAASGNAGVAYWSHDLGGHFSAGKGVDPELSARWIQFGALSPVMRVHCSRDPSVDRRPWLHGEEHARAARKAFALRSRLLPYLYTSARQCHEAGLPLLRPMYLHYPDEDQAYASPQQYLIGEDLLASPVVRPGFGPGKLVHAKVWFPAGDWYHWETHQMFRGPLETVVPTDLDAMPLFVRGGAPVCLQDPGSQRVCDTHQPMVVRLYPGPAADRAHYEDDGESLAYQGGAWRKTPLCGNPLDGGGQLLVLGPAEGAQPAGAEFGAASPDAGGDGQSRRDWIVELPGHPAVDAAEGVVRGLERGLDGLTRVSLGPLGPKDRVELRVHWGGAHPADGLSQSLRALESRLGLAGRQLPQLHALAQELIGLAAEAQQAWQSLAREDAHRDGEALRRTAAWDALRDLRLRSGNLFDALAQGGHEFACRVLAGLSLQCVVLSAPGGACVLQVELRREAAELPSQTGISMGTGSGPLALAYRVEGGDWLEARVALEPSCVSVWNIALELDRGRLGWTRGAVRLQVDLEGAQSGRSMTLSEPFAWDGRVVKDWVGLGPLDPLDCPRPPRDATDLDWGAAWKDRGGEARHWRPLAMQAARVARATRHFYDLGEALLCPQGAVCAATLIHAGRDGGVGLELAHEGRAELWLNGQPLEALDGPRYTGHLRAGDNLLWVRLEGVAKRGRGFHLSVSDPSEGARALTVRLPTSSFEMTA